METVTISRSEYVAMVDARDHAQSMRDVTGGALETLGEAEMDAYLAAPSPLAFWRERHGISLDELAERTGVMRSEVAGIEDGGGGDVRVFSRMARVLGARIEDVAPV